MSLARFEDIAPRAWEHPSDRAALDALRAVPGFDRLVASTLGRVNEWVLGRRMLHDATEVTPASHPRLWEVYQEVLWALDSPMSWPLYAKPMGGLNAAAVGMDSPFIVISAEAEARVARDDVTVVLAHEVAHVLSGHILYKTMLRAALAVGWASVAVPASTAVAGGVALALLEWDRRSELSADRASALVMGDGGPVIATLRKLSAAASERWERPTPLPPALDTAFRSAARQAERVLSRHPPADARIESVREWVQSDAWAAILRGEYPRRTDETVVELAVPGRPLETLRAGLAEAVGPLSRLFGNED